LFKHTDLNSSVKREKGNIFPGKVRIDRENQKVVVGTVYWSVN
jgi:hypothetical protein